MIEDGAYFKGSIDISKAVVNKPAQPPTAAQPPAQQAAAPAPQPAAAAAAVK